MHSYCLHIKQAGTLAYLLGTNKDLIDSLTLCGEINGSDVIALHNIRSLTTLNLADTSMVSGGEHCTYCDGVKEVESIPEIDTIADYMFVNSENRCQLSSIILPNNITRIGRCAFSGNHNLSSISLPDSVEAIGDEAFSCCSSITSVELGCSLKIIGEQAFWNTVHLTSITFPESVSEIGEMAFFKTPLESIVVKNLIPPLIAIKDYSNDPMWLLQDYAREGAFDEEIFDTCVLYVPIGCMQLYKAAEGWKGFKNIVEV